MADAAVNDATRHGRRQGRMEEPESKSTGPAAGGGGGAPTAGRRKAADGSELMGGRVDAPSGWGESSTNAGAAFSRRPAATAADASAATRVAEEDGDDKGGRRSKFGDDKPEEATMVLQDSAPEDLSEQVAAAPRNIGGRKVQTLAELTDDNSRMMGAAAAAASSAGARVSSSAVDLSLLMSVVSPPEALEEPDEPWEFERMLQQVAQEMSAEQEKREADEAGASANS